MRNNKIDRIAASAILLVHDNGEQIELNWGSAHSKRNKYKLPCWNIAARILALVHKNIIFSEWKYKDADEKEDVNAKCVNHYEFDNKASVRNESEQACKNARTEYASKWAIYHIHTHTHN